MDDGKELIEMVCMCYESPDDADEDDMHDFSEFLPHKDDIVRLHTCAP